MTDTYEPPQAGRTSQGENPPQPAKSRSRGRITRTEVHDSWPAPALRLAVVVVSWLNVTFSLVSFGETPPPESPPAQISQTASPPTPRPLTDSDKLKLQNDLRTKDPDRRCEIIQQLSRYNDVASVRLIVQYGLKDRNPRLRDESFAALSASRGEGKVDNFLLDLLRSDLRAARHPLPEQLNLLAKAVGDRRSAGTTTELIRLALDADEAIRELGVDAILWSVDRIGVERDGAAIPCLYTLTSSPLFERSSGIRKAVCDAFRRIERVEALVGLASCLEKIDGELRWEAVSHLQRVTGQEEPTATAWLEWLNRHGPTFRWPAKPPGEVPVASPGVPLYYYKIPIHAERIVFVLDVSKSMGLGGTTSRLAAAQQELLRTIDKLPDGVLFNVIAFQTKVIPWQERLHPSSPGSRAHAAAFVRSQRPQGKTATYEALHSALNMSPEPELIFLLSDGLPSAGAMTMPDRVIASVNKVNQRRRIRIHTLGTLAGPQDAAFGNFLERLARENSGEFRRID